MVRRRSGMGSRSGRGLRPWAPDPSDVRWPCPGRDLSELRSGSACLLRRTLQSVAVAVPPLLVPSRHVAVALQQPDGTIDQLSDDVGVPGVSLGVDDDVDQGLVQRDLVLADGPMRHLSDGVEGQGVDGGIGMAPGPALQLDDLFARLIGPGPLIGVGLGVILEPRRRLSWRASEGSAEVDELRMGLVLDEPEQVGASRHQRPADVVFRQPVELPHEGLTTSLQVVLEDSLRFVCGHTISLSPSYPWYFSDAPPRSQPRVRLEAQRPTYTCPVNRVVVVTGSSSGIGLATALSFARAGDAVVATVRDPAG